MLKVVDAWFTRVTRYKGLKLRCSVYLTFLCNCAIELIEIQNIFIRNHHQMATGHHYYFIKNHILVLENIILIKNNVY